METGAIADEKICKKLKNHVPIEHWQVFPGNTTGLDVVRLRDRIHVTASANHCQTIICSVPQRAGVAGEKTGSDLNWIKPPDLVR